MHNTERLAVGTAWSRSDSDLPFAIVYWITPFANRGGCNSLSNDVNDKRACRCTERFYCFLCIVLVLRLVCLFNEFNCYVLLLFSSHPFHLFLNRYLGRSSIDEERHSWPRRISVWVLSIDESVVNYRRLYSTSRLSWHRRFAIALWMMSFVNRKCRFPNILIALFPIWKS